MHRTRTKFRFWQRAWTRSWVISRKRRNWSDTSTRLLSKSNAKTSSMRAKISELRIKSWEMFEHWPRWFWINAAKSSSFSWKHSSRSKKRSGRRLARRKNWRSQLEWLIKKMTKKRRNHSATKSIWTTLSGKTEKGCCGCCFRRWTRASIQAARWSRRSSRHRIERRRSALYRTRVCASSSTSSYSEQPKWSAWLIKKKLLPKWTDSWNLSDWTFAILISLTFW